MTNTETRTTTERRRADIFREICREIRRAEAAAEIMTARIYLEFEDWSTTVKAEINPYTESISISKEA